MISRYRSVRTRWAVAPWLLLAALGMFGCGGAEQMAVTRLPENVMTHPVGPVAVVSLAPNSPAMTSMRALGVGARGFSPDSLSAEGLRGFRVVLLEEGVLSDKRMLGGFPLITEHVRRGATLLLMQQDPEVMRKLRERYTDMIAPRATTYALEIVPTRRTDEPMKVLRFPNPVDGDDLDSLSLRAAQVVSGGEQAVAVLASNVLSPDSTAVLLRQPYGRGELWYCSVPLSGRAALGFAAEQKLLANLLSWPTAIGR